MEGRRSQVGVVAGQGTYLPRGDFLSGLIRVQSKI